jgi:heme exporter protein C
MTLLFLAMHLKAMRNEVLRRRVKALRTVEVEATGGFAAEPAE